MRAVILAAGHGTRLRPHTHTGPKHMLPVANKPVIEYLVEKLADAGITEVAIIVGYMEDFIKEYFHDGSRWGLSITYIEQEKRLGLAHAISLAKDFVGKEPFLILLGDNLFHMPLSKIIDIHKASKAPCSIVLTEVEHPEKLGVVKLDNGKIIDIVEKPKLPPSNLAAIGLYFFDNPKVFEIIRDLKPSWRGEYEVTDAIKGLLNSGVAINPIKLEGYWKDTGMPEDLIAANRLVLKDIKSSPIPPNITARGSVKLGKDVTFLGEVILRGPVAIGNNCIIDNTVLGPNVSIGPNSKIESSVISESIIFNDCFISKTILESSIIGRDSTVTPKQNGKPRLVVGDHSKVQV